MKRIAYYIIVFLPPFALCAYYVLGHHLLTLTWCDFFQTRRALAFTFKWFMVILPLLACFLGILLLKLAQLLSILWTRRWVNLKKWGTETVLIILIPLLGFGYSICLSGNSSFLTNLRDSFNNMAIDTDGILAWLDSLDGQAMERKVLLFYEEADLPLNVREALLSLRPNSVWLEVAKDNRPYLNLWYTSVGMDVGVVIGADYQAAMLPYGESLQTIDAGQRVFLWQK